MTQNPRSYTTKTNFTDRLSGVLYGVAVGDGLGAPLEFLDASTIRSKYGTVREMIGGGWLNVAPGEVTDDTQMTLCVAEGIEESPYNPIDPIGRRFVEWYKSGPKDVGGTCAMSISGAIRHGSNPIEPSFERWYEASRDTHAMSGGKSAGNGSLMRTAYVGIYYPEEHFVASFAADISQMTHYDTLAADACVAYSLMIHRMIREGNPNTRRAIIPETIADCGYSDTYNCEVLGSELFRPQPTGYVVDSFKAALHCILTTDTFEEAVVKAVNLGGDADTIGAITGGLAGALYGFTAIPIRWLTRLDPAISSRIDRLNRIAIEAQPR